MEMTFSRPVPRTQAGHRRAHHRGKPGTRPGKAFWRIREMFGHEVQRHIGASIGHTTDASKSWPVAAVPAFIEEANAAVKKIHPRLPDDAVRPSR